MQCT